MQSNKTLTFQGKAGGYFVVWLVTIVMLYIPFFGWAFALNFVANWLVSNTQVDGKKLMYRAGYGESLGFVLVNFLLLFITLGIYVFWFVPKLYRYVMNHVSYADESSSVTASTPSYVADMSAPQKPTAPKRPLVQ